MAYIPLPSHNPPPSRQQWATDTQNKATAHFHALLSFFFLSAFQLKNQAWMAFLCVSPPPARFGAEAENGWRFLKITRSPRLFSLSSRHKSDNLNNLFLL